MSGADVIEANEADLLKGETGDWEIVIGLEVHAQISTESKLFSGASTKFGAAPNSQVSFVDAGFPGMLPVINAKCVEQAVRSGLGINGHVETRSVFERKNYFYPDLPQGYQISQYQLPLITEGELVIELKGRAPKRIGIERLHVEQDAGKSMHDQHPKQSYIDLNRSGVALMEIVSKPDLRSAEEAGAYVTKLRSILRYLGTCDGNMQEGSLRVDANVSVHKPGTEFGTRCEIKNLNSIRFLKAAIEHEARRQIEIVEEGGEIAQETRLFDTGQGITRSMRSKEEAHDYRYFPDPDLLPLELEDDFIEKIRASLPELPDQKKARFIEQFGLSDYDAAVLVAEQENAAFFEQAAEGRDAKLVANWLITELFAVLNKEGKGIDESPVAAQQLGELVGLIEDKTISGRIAKDVFEKMVATGKDPAAIVEEEGLVQITDTGALEGEIDKLIAENPGQVEAFRGGNEKILGWFVGQMMKATQGKANPQMVNELLRKKLS